MMSLKERFRCIAQHTAHAVGSAAAFGLALAVVIAWVLTGPIFHYSDTWQLVINTATTIVTFLMVFLIQNAQNRDAKAIHLKLDELIRSIGPARNKLMDLEEMTEEELEKLQKEFRSLHDKVEDHLEELRNEGEDDTPLRTLKKNKEGPSI